MKDDEGIESRIVEFDLGRDADPVYTKSAASDGGVGRATDYRLSLCYYCPSMAPTGGDFNCDVCDTRKKADLEDCIADTFSTLAAA